MHDICVLHVHVYSCIIGFTCAVIFQVCGDTVWPEVPSLWLSSPLSRILHVPMPPRLSSRVCHQKGLWTLTTIKEVSQLTVMSIWYMYHIPRCFCLTQTVVGWTASTVACHTHWTYLYWTCIHTQWWCQGRQQFSYKHAVSSSKVRVKCGGGSIAFVFCFGSPCCCVMIVTIL